MFGFAWYTIRITETKPVRFYVSNFEDLICAQHQHLQRHHPRATKQGAFNVQGKPTSFDDSMGDENIF